MLNLLRKRRSIRKFKKKTINAAVLGCLKEACVRAPSSRGRQPWRFYFITDKKLLLKLSEAKSHGAEFLKGAPLGVLICGDETLSDVWIEDCSIAGILLQMTSLSLGLGSCWIQLRLRKREDEKTSQRYVQKLLKLPPKIKVECIIAIGYPAERKKPVPSKTLPYGKIISR